MNKSIWKISEHVLQRADFGADTMLSGDCVHSAPPRIPPRGAEERCWVEECLCFPAESTVLPVQPKLEQLEDDDGLMKDTLLILS